MRGKVEYNIWWCTQLWVVKAGTVLAYCGIKERKIIKQER